MNRIPNAAMNRAGSGERPRPGAGRRRSCLGHVKAAYRGLRRPSLRGFPGLKPDVWLRAVRRRLGDGPGPLLVVLTLLSGMLSAHAESPAGDAGGPYGFPSFDREHDPLSTGVGACESANGEAVSADCLRDRAVNDVLLGEVTRFATERGRDMFGERFRIVNRMAWSSGGSGLTGDVDAVFPLSFTAAREPSVDGGRRESRALFVQWGVTRWIDDEGTDRNDVRIGAVRRVAVSQEPRAGVLGFSALYQQGVESEHGRLVTGVDYAGAWGSGWLHHYAPVTGWRPGRSRHEERALAGMELGVRIEPTRTISLDTALTRWESADGTGRWTTGARVGLSWRPHPWLSMRTGWEDIGIGRETASIRLTVAIPFGGAGQAVPRWTGLGIAGGGSGGQGDAEDIWRPIENVGRLHVAERAIPVVPEVVPAVDETGDSAPRFSKAVAAQSYTLGTAIRTLWLPRATGGNGALT